MNAWKNVFLSLVLWTGFTHARAQVQIMPLGDSITLGAYDSGAGYRDQLFVDLTANGITFKFIGASGYNASSQLISAGQQYHNGYGSYRADHIRTNLDGIVQPGGSAANNEGGYWLTGGNTTGPQLNRPAVFPNIVLLHIGTNDVSQNTPLATLQTRLTSILNWFKANRPNTDLFVAQITPWGDAARGTTGKNNEVKQYNAWIAATVPGFGAKFHVVDIYSLFVDGTGAIKSGWLHDGIHPTHTGYVAMGNAWFDAIKGYLGTGSGVPLASGTYKIINRNSGKAVDATAKQTANGTNIEQWSYNGGTNQRWTVTSLGGREYTIIGVQSGRSLDMTANSSANGASLELYDYHGGDNQKWMITPTTGGYYTVVSVNSGKAMEVSGSSVADGGAIDQWTSSGANNTQWSFQAP